MKEYKIKLKPNELQKIDVQGDYFKLLYPVDAEIELTSYTNEMQGKAKSELTVKAGMSVLIKKFDYLVLKSLSSAEMFIICLIGEGVAQDNRIVGAVEIESANSFVGLPNKKAVTGLSGQVIAGNPERKKLVIYADANNQDPVYLGTNTIGEGIPLLAGGAFEVEAKNDLQIRFVDNPNDKIYLGEVI